MRRFIYIVPFLLFFICTSLHAQNKKYLLLKKIHRTDNTLPDADKDGVTDQFDKEPNTPAGCPVDTHGVSLDTDHDGVPDCKDKEPLTQMSCFPVDSLGRGTCITLADTLRSTAPVKAAPALSCNMNSLPYIDFESGSTTLSSKTRSILDGIVAEMKANPGCNLGGYVYYLINSKASEKLADKRKDVVTSYLVKVGGIDEGRVFIDVFAGNKENEADFFSLAK